MAGNVRRPAASASAIVVIGTAATGWAGAAGYPPTATLWGGGDADVPTGTEGVLLSYL